MPSSDLTYTGLEVALQENPDTGFADIGVVVEDAFIPIGRVYLADLHEKIHEAAKAKADAKESKSK
jgi:hypothetical protein